MPKINSKDKGRRNELAVAKDISDVLHIPYGTEIRRTPNSGALITRADLWVHPKHRAVFPFFVEIKSGSATRWSFDGIVKGEKWEPYVWYREAVEKLSVDPEYDKDSPVILIFTKNRLPFFVLISREDNYYYVGDFQIFFKVNGSTFIVYLWEDFLKTFAK